MKAHPKFRKKGNDIEATEFLTISQAVLGHKETVETMYGNKDIAFPAGCQDGQRISIKGSVSNLNDVGHPQNPANEHGKG